MTVVDVDVLPMSDPSEDRLAISVAYADPPYLGCCGLYGHNHPDGRCWDDLETHRLLIDHLVSDFPDGWALSLTSSSLARILPLCPAGVRVGAWVKPFHAYKKGVRPAYGWEPVIFRGGRNKNHAPPMKGGEATTPKDWVAESITLRKGLTGAKPERFSHWVFSLLGLRPGDGFADLFPGTAAVDDAWLTWDSQIVSGLIKKGAQHDA